jgi:PLP dependent protein
MGTISARYEEFIGDLELICQQNGRKTEEIDVLAATKYASVDEVNELIRAGIRLVGENKIQDAKKKIGGLLPVRKHFIGHLQTNKVKDAVRLFDLIESVDSYKLAVEIDRQAGNLKLVMPVLLQVNAGSEVQKYGFAIDDVFNAVREIAALKSLKVKGLMAVMPNKDKDQIELYFQKMKDIFDELRISYPEIVSLSVGMSHDYDLAVRYGATEIRIGSAFFG